MLWLALGSYRNGLAGLVGLGDFSGSPSSAGLVGSGMRVVPGVTADAAFHSQMLLMNEAAAVALVVVVVGRSLEPVS